MGEGFFHDIGSREAAMYKIFSPFKGTEKATMPVRSVADRAGDFLGVLFAVALVAAIILGLQGVN
jgi:hypothetical protein